MGSEESVGKYVRIDREAPLPIATQLSQQLGWLIATGEFAAATRMPSVRTLGDTLGISLHTVRAAYRLLEDDGLVTTRQGRGTTVLPRDSTRLAARGPDVPSFTFGVILPAYSPFFTQLLGGIEEASTLAALPFVCNVKQDPDAVMAYLDLLVAKGTDGIIVISALLPLNLELPAGAPPVVFADIPGAPGPSLEFDLEGIAFEATAHLLSHGHEAVGLIGPPPEWPNVAPKYRGYQRALREAGLPVRSELIASVPNFGIDDGRIAAARLLDLADRPTAIYAAGDLLAIGAMRTMKERHVSIPGEMALVGSDNLELSAVVDPSLTTVTTPAHEMGSEAIAMLESLIQGQPAPAKSVVVRSALVRRASCGCEHSEAPFPPVLRV